MPWYSFLYSKLPSKMEGYDFVEPPLIQTMDGKQQLILKFSNLVEANNIKSSLLHHVNYLKRELFERHSELSPAFNYTYKEKTDRTGAVICISGDLEEAITQLLRYEAFNLNTTNSLLKEIGSPFQFTAAGKDRYNREVRPKEKQTVYSLEVEEPTSRASSNSM